MKSSTGRARRRRQLALLALAAAGAAQAGDPLPTGGRVVAGQATLNYAGNTLTIRQGGDKAAIDWNGFSIGQGQTVNFVQPSAGAVALNRVVGADASAIQGALNANGHVFLLNPNGVLFSSTARVDVGGLLASTLAMSNEDFLAGRYRLQGDSNRAVENQGAIRAVGGGNVALVAARVANTGEIDAAQGNALLGAGSDVVVDFGGPVKLQVRKGALDALVDNGGAIRADGGTVLMTAKSAGELSGSVINNSGIVQARTLATGAQGRIMLLGDMQSGAASVGGTLDASAPAGGDGGHIETSAAHVTTLPGLAVTAGAGRNNPAGKGGEWLVDPYDYTITSAGAATISNTLNQGTSVTVTTQSSNAGYGTVSGSNGSGDITVGSSIAKTAGGDATLTLRADRNVIVDNAITATGSGKLNVILSAANAANATVGGVDINANVKSNGGDILIGGNGGSASGGIGFARNANTTRTIAAVTIENNVSILSTGGNITINGKTNAQAQGGSTDGTRGGIYIKAGATILAGTGNLRMTGESVGDINEFGIGFQAGSGTVTTVGSAPGAGTVLINANNATPGSRYTSSDWDAGAMGMVNYGSRDQVVFQGPSVANWLIYINGAPRPSAYTQAPQLAGCLNPYPNCGYLLVSGSNNSYLYATYQAVDMATKPIYVLGTSAGTKVYDGTTVATGMSFTAVGGPAGYTAASLSPAPVFNTRSKNVDTYGSLIPGAGNPRDVTAGGTTYAVGYFYNGNYAITPKSLTPSAADKVYDGTTTAAVAMAGAIAGDDVTAGGNGNFGSKNVGTYQVSISNITLSGNDAQNYTLAGNAASATASITPRTVSLNATKVYDGSANFSGVALGNLVSGEDLVATGVAANSANVATARYVSAVSLADGAAGLAANYQLPSLAAAGAYNTAAITPRALTVSGLSASDKVYDGTTTAQLTGGAVSGMVGGEIVTVSALTGAFADKNVGANKAVSLAGGLLADGTGLASNYTLAQPTGLTAAITPKALTVSGITANDKAYDGTTAATVATAGVHLQGLVSGDAVIVNATGTFADPDAASGKTVTLASTHGGADAGNYTITDQATATAAITPKALTVAGLSAATRTYDGTTAATLAGGALSGLVGGETLDLSGLVGAFSDKNAGSGKAVTVSAGALADGTGRAANYSLTLPTGVVGTITPKALTVAGITASDKVYDGTTAATVSAAGAQLAGAIAGDDVGLNAGGAFADKNAGANRTVNLTTGLTGRDAGNYTAGGQATALAAITPKALTVSGITATDKTYDGTTAATVSTAHARLDGLVANDVVTVAASGAFADANAGANKTVALTSTHGGADAGNYTIADQASATAAITPKALTLTGLAASDKVYDGTTAATLTGGALAGLVGGETLSLSGLTGAFADKNAGAHKAVTVSGTLADGTGLASNYAIATPAGLSASIMPKTLTVSGITASDKVYDGTTAATVSTAQAQFAGLVGTDVVTVAATGAFADANAGGAKTVVLNNTFGGADAGNYAIAGQAAAQAAITPKALTLAGLAAANKTYDGTTAATLSGGILVGLVGNETLDVAGLTGTFADKNVGAAKAVTIGGGTLVDGTGRAANYSVVLPGAVTASIAPKAVTVAGITAADKVYDGTTAATVSTGGAVVQGLVAGDDVRVAASGSFVDKNAGGAKTVTLVNTFDGADAANYAITGQASATAAIARKTVTVTGAAVADKTADGTTGATLTAPGTLVGIVAGDGVAVDGAAATARFAQATAGSGIAVDVSGLALSGADAANYAFEGRTAATGSIRAAPTSTPAPVVTPAPAPVVLTPAPVVTPEPVPVVVTPAPVVVTPAPVPTPAPVVVTPAPVVTPEPTPVVVAPTPAPVATPAPAPAPAPARSTASVTAATIAPQSLGLAPVLPAPAVGGLAYLAVPETGAATAGASGAAAATTAPATATEGQAGQPAEAGEGAATVSATKRRQSSSQALAAGRDVKFLNVLVVSGGIRMPSAGADQAGANDAPNP